MANILLFGGGLQSLSIARGLKDHNHSVVNIADKHAVGKFSNYIDNFISISIQDFSLREFMSYLDKYNVDLIIPMEDEYTEWISDNKEHISKNSNCKISCVDKEIFKLVINKHSLLHFCALNNIPHPVTLPISKNTDEKLIKKFSFPALIKPDISNGSRGIQKVINYNDYKNKIESVKEKFGTCTLQEFIENDHYYNVMLYRYADGGYAPSVVIKIIRFYPINGGSSSFCISVVNNKIIEVCKELLNNLNWHGFADLDVLEKGEEEYKIIEINPRVPASVHAAYISGIDYGYIIVEDLLFGKRPEMRYCPGQQLRGLGLDIAWFCASPNRFQASPSWFKFFGKQLHYQEGGIKDWKSMIYSIWLGIKKQMSPSFRKAKAGMN